MKILTVDNIRTCKDCPYCEYDPHYSISYDSGYDCTKDDCEVGRIVNDHEIEHKSGKYYNSFPPIPKECNLEDV